jgi:hypothetical protein
MVSTTGQTAVNMKDGGTMGNSMDWEHTLIKIKRVSSTVCGRMAKE